VTRSQKRILLLLLVLVVTAILLSGCGGVDPETGAYKPGIFDKHLPDRIVSCTDEEAFDLARRLARQEGIFVGMSSGAALAGALKVASGMDSGTIVVIFPDGGERYLSTPLFELAEDADGSTRQMVLRLTNTWSRKKEHDYLLEKLMRLSQTVM
jgi:cysteinyl-tRNA synthetase